MTVSMVSSKWQRIRMTDEEDRRGEDLTWSFSRRWRELIHILRLFFSCSVFVRRDSSTMLFTRELNLPELTELQFTPLVAESGLCVMPFIGAKAEEGFIENFSLPAITMRVNIYELRMLPCTKIWQATMLVCITYSSFSRAASLPWGS